MSVTLPDNRVWLGSVARLIKNILQENISSAINRDVSIETLNINYLSGEAKGKNISLLNKKFDGYLY